MAARRAAIESLGAEDEARVFRRLCDEVTGQGFDEGLFVCKDGTVLRAK